MAEEIGALRVALTAATATFERDMKAAREAVQTNTRHMERALYSLRDSFNNSLKGAFSLRNILPQVFAAASVAGLVSFVKSSIDAADRMDDLSKSAGVSVEALSSMGYAAKFSGLDVESLATGFKKLSKSMSEAASGTGDTHKAFADLGISVKNNDGTLKTSEQVMLELADKFAGMEDGAGKTALAMKFFGKSGADLIPFLNDGAAGIARLQQEARDLGVVMSTEAAQAAAEFNDNLDRLVANIKGSVLPYVGDLVRGINAVFDAVKQSNWEKLDKAEEKLQKLKEFQQIMASGSRVKIFEKSREATSLAPELGSFWDFVAKNDEALKKLQETIKTTEQEVTRLQDVLTHKAPPKKTPAPTPANEEAEKLKAAIDKQIVSLVEQANVFSMTETEAQLYKLAIQGASAEQIALARDLLIAIEAQKKSNDEWEKSQELVKEQAAEGKRLFEGTRTPLEALNTEVQRLSELYKNGAIDAETFSRAVEQAEERFGEKIKKTTEEGKDRFADLKSAIEGWGRSSADAFAEFAMSGKASFSDLANSIIKDILRMMAYKMIFEPMFKGIGNLFSSPSTSTTPNAHGNAFERGRVIPFAKGGVVNRPTTFSMGLMGEAGPEGILPLARLSGGDLGVKADLGGGMGPMKIEIINKSGQPMEVTDAKFNFQDAVVSVWVDAYDRNKGGLRTRMGG